MSVWAFSASSQKPCASAKAFISVARFSFFGRSKMPPQGVHPLFKRRKFTLKVVYFYHQFSS